MMAHEARELGNPLGIKPVLSFYVYICVLLSSILCMPRRIEKMLMVQLKDEKTGVGFANGIVKAPVFVLRSAILN